MNSIGVGIIIILLIILLFVMIVRINMLSNEIIGLKVRIKNNEDRIRQNLL